MLSLIQIRDDYEKIITDYKFFKKTILRKWSGFNEYSYQIEEKKLLDSIQSLLQIPLPNSKLHNQNITEDNIMRALFGIKILSRYSLLYREDCTFFYYIIISNLPKSIQKRKFLIKHLIKESQNQVNLETDIKNQIFQSSITKQYSIESTENTLIYINFLLQYSPDFFYQISSEIFSQLFRIIQENDYKLDFSYNFQKFTHFTTDKKCFSNNAIDLLHQIFTKEKMVDLQSIEIRQLFEWKSVQKAFATICVLIETGKHFVGPNFNLIYQFIKYKKNSDEEVQCIITRILIIMTTIQDDIMNNDLLNNIFEFDSNLSEIVICGKLQNLKLLIQLNHQILNTVNQKVITEIIFNCFEKKSEMISFNCLDLLNSCLLFNAKEKVYYFEINYERFDRFFELKILFEFNEIVKLMFENNQEKLINEFFNLFDSNPLDILNFFIKNDSINFMKKISQNSKENFFKYFCELKRNPNEQIRPLVPYASLQLFPHLFFTFDNLYNILLCDSSLQMKFSTLHCFNCFLNQVQIDEYPKLEINSFEKMKNLFKRILNDDLSTKNIQFEIIVLLKKYSNEFNFYEVFEPFLNYFKSFSKKEEVSKVVFDIEKYSVNLRKLSNLAECLPLIIESFPKLFENHIQYFYEFSIDFLQVTSKFKDKEYKNKTKLSFNQSLITIFQQKYKDTIKCSFLKAIQLFVMNDFMSAKSYLDEIIEFCIDDLYYGSNEDETFYLLSLIEGCLHKVGIEEALNYNKTRNQTNLFKIIFDTGSRFTSTTILKLVFRILSFIGARPLPKKEIPIYDVYDENYELNSLLQNEMTNYSNEERQENISYIICSNSLFHILNDEAKKNIHFAALETLVSNMGITFCQKIYDDFPRAFRCYKKLLHNSCKEEKKKFVVLLDSMCNIQINIIKNYIFEIVKALIELWDYDSIEIVKSFSSHFESLLKPYLNDIIPMIRSYPDIDVSIDVLIHIYLHCLRDSTDENILNFDVISIIIKMVENGKYQGLSAIKKLLPYINNLYKYIPSIVKISIDCINKFKTSEENHKYLVSAVKLLHELISYESPSYSSLLNNFRQLIKKTIQPFIGFTVQIKKGDFHKKKKLLIECDSNLNLNESETSSLFLSSEFNIEYFTSLLFSIKNYNLNKVKSIYIEKWLNEVVLFCIQNSPITIIRNCSSISEKDELFALSLFNIAFHSFYNEFLSFGYEEAENTSDDISSFLIELLKATNISSESHLIIANLIEYLDREGDITFDLNNLNIPITTLFSREPTLSLRFSLLHFERTFSLFTRMNKKISNSRIEDKLKNAAIDLGQAYLNAGSLDEYQSFSRFITNRVKNLSPLNSTVKYHLPIFANSISDNHHLKKANNLFVLKDWKHFNKEIEKFHYKIISHLYKTASLIQQSWSENRAKLTNEINKEINLGFEEIVREGCCHFSRGFSSVLQYIIYGQQLIELQEMFLSNNQLNNFQYRFKNSEKILNYFPQIILLRMSSKSDTQSSFNEKYELISDFRKSNKIETMKTFYKYFYPQKAYVPIEIEYEMMYYKLINNIAKESEFDSLLARAKKKNNNDLIEKIKYQKSLFFTRDKSKLKDIIFLCEGIDNIEAKNLWSFANLNLFETSNRNDIQLLNNAINGFIECSLKSDQMRTSQMMMIVSLLFKYFNSNIESASQFQIECIKEELIKIPNHFYLEIISQVISYIPTLQECQFKDYINELLYEIMKEFPQGVIFDYSLSLFPDNEIINGQLIFSPLNEVKLKLCREDSLYKRIFNESFKLTKNLYKATTDIHVTICEFLEKVLSFLTQFEECEIEEDEISFFIENTLEIFIKEHLFHLKCYYSQTYEKERYEPNLIEKTFLDDFEQAFDAFSYSIEILKENLLNYNFDSKKNEIKILINEVKSRFDDIYLFIKYYRKEIDTNLYDLSPKIKEMNNLNLPVFGTYRYNEEIIFIKEINQEITIFDSMKYSKKITVIGSDGHYYSFILKITEFLVLDQRIMIFNHFLNQYLFTKLKTYSITPLTLKFGVIQYVNGMTTLNQMIIDYRKKVGSHKYDDEKCLLSIESNFFNQELNNNKQQEDEEYCYHLYDKLSLIQHLEIFRYLNQITKERKNDLRESIWSISTTSEKWFESAINYTLTCSVSSIVGHLIGLGDRNLNSIMINKENGYLMHIDFCDSFEYSEKVPFRMTRNLVSAFGPCGTEGTFSEKCEETLSLIRTKKEIIMNTMKIFIELPLFGHNRKNKILSQMRDDGIISKILSDKFNGTDRNVISCEDETESFSIRDQVKMLILQASDEYKLSQSSSYWCPWI